LASSGINVVLRYSVYLDWRTVKILCSCTHHRKSYSSWVNTNVTCWMVCYVCIVHSLLWLYVHICCSGECTTFTLNLALQARSRVLGPLSPSFELVKNLRTALDKFLPDNAHEIASGRLHISLTRVSDKQNVLVSEFTDKNDLIDVSPSHSAIINHKCTS